MKLVVFDCDGTLVDSQHMIVAAMEQAFANFGMAKPGRADILSVVGLSLDEAVRRLVPPAIDTGIAALAEAYKSAFGELRRDKAHQEPLYPGVRETLHALANEPGVLLGVATGKSRRGLAAVLEREGLTDLFITLQTADTHPSKPHPAMLQAAMAEAGTQAHRTLMVGDTTYDIAMARDAGARAIGVAWGYHPVTELEAAGAHRVLADSLMLSEALSDEMRNLD
ncbi:MAG: haloacid dehalogenase [Hyphomicrobium sp. 32-62-53]|nr:MAG: haloacid dehalogenase [Hyphomicrobium sp. 12-62-95]OYX98620.1 MAG: haloacid dehalogenase [Hyphomicrobium sp. 32-62-53]